jgi:flavin-dependent dehydrogenase
MMKHIVIVGGGTAGWATANICLNRSDLKVTVIASKEIPIIGVGESTTGRFNDLICRLGNATNLNEKEFLKETESTFKLGIKHTSWHTVGKSFYSPIGDSFYNQTLYPHSDYDYMRIFHIAQNIEYNKMLQSQLMIKNKLPYLKNDEIDIYNHLGSHKTDNSIPIAYHLDTYKVGQYLKRKALNLNRCSYIEDTVIDFQQSQDGSIKNIITKNKKNVKADLFIDCSGFFRILINKKFKNDFISYQKELMVNRALTFFIDNKEGDAVRNYTHAWAQKYGWLWEIPTQKRLGCGYVYCDNYINPDQAQKEIEKILGHKINPQNDIKFSTGRLNKFWIKNVLSTGLASAFIEPLEATSIHCTIMQINHFFENYFKKDLKFKCDKLINQYNSEMTTMWDNIKDFIVFHYISPRKDTDFWIEAKNIKRHSERLKIIMEIWKHRMPRVVDYITDKNNNFYHIGNTLWYQIGIGMKLFDAKIAKQELVDYNLYNYAKDQYKKITSIVRSKLSSFEDTNIYYNKLFK